MWVKSIYDLDRTTLPYRRALFYSYNLAISFIISDANMYIRNLNNLIYSVNKNFYSSKDLNRDLLIGDRVYYICG